MQSIKRQSGASMITWMILAGIAGFMVVIALRLFPLYMEAFAIESALESVAKETGISAESKGKVWSLISKRLDINDVHDVTIEDFSIEKTNDGVYFSIYYEARANLLGNLDGVVVVDKRVEAR